MSRRRADDRLTRQRLIEAATRQFAAQGFKRVTVRAICREARANVAAVNYHFRDKLGLYTQVIEAAAEVVREATAEAIAAGHGLPPRERLRAYIRVHAARILALSGPSAFQQLMHREMNEPTDAVFALVDRTFRPRFDYLAQVIGEILDLPSTDHRVVLAANSIHGQIVLFMPSKLAERIGAEMHIALTSPEIAAHLEAFSLAGLDAYAPAGARVSTPVPI